MTLTRQEIFAKVWRGLKAQGFRQSLSDAIGGCAYRGDDGLRCAAGHLLEDVHYCLELEGNAVDGDGHNFLWPVDRAIIASGVGRDDLVFVASLQLIHDNHGSPADMDGALRSFAAEHGLLVPEEK